MCKLQAASMHTVDLSRISVRHRLFNMTVRCTSSLYDSLFRTYRRLPVGSYSSLPGTVGPQTRGWRLRLTTTHSSLIFEPTHDREVLMSALDRGESTDSRRYFFAIIRIIRQPHAFYFNLICMPRLSLFILLSSNPHLRKKFGYYSFTSKSKVPSW